MPSKYEDAEIRRNLLSFRRSGQMPSIGRKRALGCLSPGSMLNVMIFSSSDRQDMQFHDECNRNGGDMAMMTSGSERGTRSSPSRWSGHGRTHARHSKESSKAITGNRKFDRSGSYGLGIDTMTSSFSEGGRNDNDEMSTISEREPRSSLRNGGLLRLNLKEGPVDPFASANNSRRRRREVSRRKSFVFEADFAHLNKRRRLFKTLKAKKSMSDTSMSSSLAHDTEPIINGMDITDEDFLKQFQFSCNLTQQKTNGNLSVNKATAKKAGVKFRELLRKKRAGSKSNVQDLTSSETEQLGKNGAIQDYHLLNDTQNANASNQNGNAIGAVEFTPPAYPSSIDTTLKGLALIDFEQKAKQRAAATIWAWIFDAGLIDELQVNGGISNRNLLRGRSFGGLDDQSIDQSVKTSEGVEVSAFGNPIEGATKMDREIAKLRSSARRQLDDINSLLNDGVEAGPNEVRELANAIATTTKNDTSNRLRELTTYISNSADIDRENDAVSARYPHMKRLGNARRNFGQVFRELEFLNQIPDTCERLLAELDASESAPYEWTILLSVCRQHIDIVNSLVQIEAGLKQQLYMDHSGGTSASTEEQIGQFLKKNFRNVRDLGNKVRLKIEKGFKDSFHLALDNPSGLVAVVDSIDLYEVASKEYKTQQGEKSHKCAELLFFGMRGMALEQLYKDMEQKCIEMFRDLTMEAADAADEEEAFNQKFSAVLQAANELTQDRFVRDRMSLCFTSDWAVLILWSTCVAYICSNQVMQQIGGPAGHNLSYMTVRQQLDLVAWVETFIEIIEDSFPGISSTSSKRTYFDAPPNLLIGKGEFVDIDQAKDCLAWVTTFLWSVHDSAKDEFLIRTKKQTEEWLDNVYEADHVINQTGDGRLVTSLCEDVYSIAGTQLRIIRERLTQKSEALIQAASIIIRTLYEKQIASRNIFLTDFEACCAATNDFLRMAEKCEYVVTTIKEGCRLTSAATEALDEQAAALMGLYSSDAVYAGQKSHIYIFEPIEEVVANDLFGQEWLDNLTHNELALTLVRTLDDFMQDLEKFLDEVILVKTAEALVTATVLFYVTVLLRKVNDQTDRRKEPYFSDCSRALARMADDISHIRQYFEGLSGKIPTLTRVIQREFEFLDVINELMAIAAENSHSEARDFILLLQKRIRNSQLTKFVVGDIWYLMQPRQERFIYELMDSMDEEMEAVAPADVWYAVAMATDRASVPGLRYDQVMAKHVDNCKRRRPLKPGAIDQVEKVLNRWRTTWVNEYKISRPKSSLKKFRKSIRKSLVSKPAKYGRIIKKNVKLSKLKQRS